MHACMRAAVMREIAVLKKLDHPNVVRLYEVINQPDVKYIMMVLEYLEMGPVQQTKSQTEFGR
jgi:[calcium/calmodulin-dependent protein kinase] kinase